MDRLKENFEVCRKDLVLIENCIFLKGINIEISSGFRNGFVLFLLGKKK